MSPPFSLLASPFFSIKETPHSGRGVYASTPIAAGTLLLETSHVAAKCIYREYRKEVCAQCFKYDRGRSWKLKNPVAGVVFCRQECHDEWTAENKLKGAIPAVALAAVEGLRGKGGKTEEKWEEEGENTRPTKQEIHDAWTDAEGIATRIRIARSQHPTKSDRRVLAQTLAIQPVRDILSFLLSATICKALEPDLWHSVLDLAEEKEPYISRQSLEMHILSYQHLLSTMPTTLLTHITADTLKTVAQKSSHNVFNIWSQDLNDGTTGGSECLGYALWPCASYFNHSCAPNVRKKREGRVWRFWADEEIEEGEELCITYLGGDEKSMCREERMEKLQKNWGFECACARCRT
ncbi:hypothetical protein BDV97DRAFT_300917 [Delphinella strobiligena]|nr:hypothetical protein BDV97DRAFT_300917 [Delphinella strobiligena]